MQTVPIFESYSLPHAILHCDLAGCVLPVNLMRISSERGYSFTATAEREIVRGVKEALCFITFDPAQTSKSIAESSNKKQTNVCLDGNIISVGAECFRCESVFQPSIIGKEAYRIHDTSFQNVMKCDVDIRVNLYANVVLPSSTTMSKRLVSA